MAGHRVLCPLCSFADVSVTVTFHVLLLSLSCFLFFPLCYPLPLTFLPCLLHAHFSLSPMSLRRTWTILGWYESRSAYTVLVSVYHYHVPIHWCSFPHLGRKPQGKHLTSGPKFYAWCDPPSTITFIPFSTLPSKCKTYKNMCVSLALQIHHPIQPSPKNDFAVGLTHD